MFVTTNIELDEQQGRYAPLLSEESLQAQLAQVVHREVSKQCLAGFRSAIFFRGAQTRRLKRLAPSLVV
ncbi:hypothetical protein NDU88_008400 [Pleurodeles waltl]|uniref:Uncharacterized protein n=1 Tax=Pleurodeles waltl TaxID=8319 RepID=A0AAV7PS27_PLEWA|nr:hypothetical protein NDU88_008400 [Pleurodeles waltl]